MSSEDSIKSKEQNNEEQVMVEASINLLNDDCLIHVFKYLSFKDKLNLERVCKRWNVVSKLSWNNVTSLKVDENFQKKYLNASEKNNTAILIKILQRSSNCLNKLNLDGTIGEIDYSKTIKETVEYFENIIELDLKHLVVPYETLKLLFENNKNIKSISFGNVYTNGNSFSSLNPDLIEVFILKNCKVDSSENMFDFFSNLKNIKVLKIYYFDINSIIDALNFGNVENISEISLINGMPIDILKVSELFLRQKSLRMIHLNEIEIDLVDTISSLSYLEEIQCEYLTDDFSDSLYRFKNLKIFHCVLDDFLDHYAQRISECINLKELSVQCGYYSLTPEGEQYLTNLQSIESLTFDIIEEGSGCSLVAMSKCKQLKKLHYHRMDFDEDNTENFEIFPNLEIFDIYGSNITNKILGELILKSPKLNYCKLKTCENIDNDFINLASSIKINRVDENILNLECYYTNIDKDNLKNISPLISLKITDTAGWVM